MEIMGADGLCLLQAVESEAAPAGSRDLPAMQVLQEVWEQQCILRERYLSLRTADCRLCPVRAQCTRAKKEPRHLCVRHQAQHEALGRIRHEQQIAEWLLLYNNVGIYTYAPETLDNAQYVLVSLLSRKQEANPSYPARILPCSLMAGRQ